MDYEYYYNNAKNRYYNACSEINSCENRINELKNQKQQKINQINQLKTDIKNNQEALEGVNKIIKSDESLKSKLTGITNKTGLASTNFSKMVSSSNVTNKIITDVFQNESTKTKSTLTNIMQTLTTKKNALTSKITQLQSQLRSAETQLQDIGTAINSTESSLQSWRGTKSSASIDMEYYRRKMNAAV